MDPYRIPILTHRCFLRPALRLHQRKDGRRHRYPQQGGGRAVQLRDLDTFVLTLTDLNVDCWLLWGVRFSIMKNAIFSRSFGHSDLREGVEAWSGFNVALRPCQGPVLKLNLGENHERIIRTELNRVTFSGFFFLAVSSISLSDYIYFSISPLIHQCVCLLICQSVNLSIHPLVCLSTCLYLSTHPSIRLSFLSFFYQSITLPLICVLPFSPMCPRVYSSIHMCVFPCTRLFCTSFYHFPSRHNTLIIDHDHISYVIFHTSYIIHHRSYITYTVSYITYHKSHIIFHRPCII